MQTAFDNWNTSPDYGQDARLSAMTPFGQYDQQGQQSNYQSIPQTTQQTASATKAGTLAMNKQQSYLSYLDQVIAGTLPGDEGAKRAGYIPMNEGPAGYSGSGYVDRNIKMAPNAIPSAYQYADIAKNQNPYGVNQLIWGGPSSGKTSNPLDYVPYSTLTGLQGNAHTDLLNALIPVNLANDVSNNLYGKWMGNWGSKFDQMAADRAAQQQSWWSGADWANKSINPAWNEVIAPATPGTPEVPHKDAVYEDIPAQHNLVTPEVQARDAIPYQPAVYQDIPEVQAQDAKPYVPAQHILVSPEQQAIAPGYQKDDAAFNAWLNQTRNEELSRPWVWDHGTPGDTSDDSTTMMPSVFQNLASQYYNDELNYWNNNTADYLYNNPFSEEFFQFNGAGAGWHAGAGALTVDYSPVYDPWGQQQNYFTIGATGNSSYLYQPAVQALGIPDFLLPYSAGQPHQDAVYQDIPEQQAQAAVPYQPAQHILISPEVQAQAAIPHQDAVYRDIPAQHNLVTPEQFYRPAVAGTPEVDLYHPQTQKPGFGTVIDPITGAAIPNWYLNGPFGSNSDLQGAYGAPGWFFQ